MHRQIAQIFMDISGRTNNSCFENGYGCNMVLCGKGQCCRPKMQQGVQYHLVQFKQMMTIKY